MFRNSASTSTTEVSVLYSQLRARTTPVASSIKKINKDLVLIISSLVNKILILNTSVAA